MLKSFSMGIIDTIIPKEINPISGLSQLGKIKEYMAQARIATFILFGLLGGILIALIILIIKKIKKDK